MDSKAWLRQIISTADALLREVRCLSECQAGPSTELANIPDTYPLRLSVPSPFHLVAELIEVGATREAAEAISMKYHASADQLANYQCNVVYTNALRKLLLCPSVGHPDFVAKFQEAHRETYRNAILKWKDKILKSVKEKFDQLVDDSKEDYKTRSFDQKFVPLLEKCFVKNQRPGREDKELLSRKTGMSYKQIHVWFQNRRSRMKKSLDRPDAQSEEPVCSSSVSSVTLVEDNPLSNGVTPSYAFPVQYPPEVLEDPFPCRFGDYSCFDKPYWSRIPSTMCRSSPDLNISGLVAAFEKLRISDAVKTSRTKRNPPSAREQDSASKLHNEPTWPFIIRPLRAPLAALIRTEGTCPQRLSGTSPPESESGKRKLSNIRSEENRSSRTRKARQCTSGKRRGSAISTKQRQALRAPAGPSPSATFSDPSPPSRVKNTEKRAPRARRCIRTGRKVNNTPDAEIVEVETPKQPREPPASQSSPTPSIESLPSLSYSSGGSSSSTYSQSPTPSFSMLFDDGHSPPHDPYQSTDCSLTLPTPQTAYGEYPSTASAFDGFSFDLAKGPLDRSFDFGLPEYPSYSDTLDSLSQGLQSSSDFAPLLSFELPPLAS